MTVEKNLADIRRRNLDSLFRDYIAEQTAIGAEPKGIVKRFSEYLGVSKEVLSHIRNGVKPISSVRARAFEVVCGKAYGWLDIDPRDAKTESAEPPTASERALLALCLKVIRVTGDAGRKEVDSLLRRLLAGGLG